MSVLEANFGANSAYLNRENRRANKIALQYCEIEYKKTHYKRV